MPPLKVEYAKSGRSKCSACKNFLLNGELRIGTGVMMPGMEEYTYKWRHICCFTTRQIKNAGSVDTVEGFDELLDEHQPVVSKMLKGEYAGNLTWQGKFIHPEKKALEEAKAEKTAKKEAGQRRKREGDSKNKSGGKKKKGGSDDDDSDDDTDDYDEDGNLVPKTNNNTGNNNMMMMMPQTNQQQPGTKTAKPMCPFGKNCFKVTKEHFDQYAHPGDAELDATVAAAVNPVNQPLPPPNTAAAAAKKTKVQPTLTNPKVKAPPQAAAAVVPAMPKPAAGGKKRCPYADNCFRKNPEHFKEFCHPGDAEWTATTNAPSAPAQQPQQQVTTTVAAAPPSATSTAAADDNDCADPNDPTKCKFGAMCFRTDPQHFKRFKHE